MMNGTDKYIATVAYLGKLYDYLNAELFGGELTKPVITIQRDERNKTNGWWSVAKVWKWRELESRTCLGCERVDECMSEDDDDFSGNNRKYTDCKKLVECEEHELNMTAQQLNRPFNEIAATMIHEMCHQYASVHEMQDTSRGGNYHNKLFRKIAETHGLTVACAPQIGWSVTALTDDTAAKIAEFTALNLCDIIYRLPVMKGQTVKTSSTRKYICPVCGMSVRATKQVNIKCVDCDELMQSQD